MVILNKLVVVVVVVVVVVITKGYGVRSKVKTLLLQRCALRTRDQI